MGRDDKRKRIASLLAETSVLGDKEVCRKYRISPRTLRRWREKALSGRDQDLTARVQAKKIEVDARLADKLDEAIDASVGFLLRAAREADPTDPNVIHSIAGALKMLQSVKTTSKLLDGRLRSAAGVRSTQPDAGPVPAAGNVRELKRTG